MLFNLYKYSFRILLRDKSAVFWLLFYPIILATIYYFSFTNLLVGEEFEKIDIAFVENENMPADLTSIINESDMFNLKIVDIETAEDMLSKAEVSGYINYNNGVELVVNKEGIRESISKVFLDNYSQITQTLTNIFTSNPELMQTGFLQNIDFQNSHVEKISVGNQTNILVIFYYAMMAMTCLMSATLGSEAVIVIQANQSPIASRINMAPTHKLKSFMVLIASHMTFHIISVLLTLFYINVILGVDFGQSTAYVLLICAVGSFMGIAFGSFISAVVKKSAGVKIAIILTVILFGCFLSGMMNVDMKYIVQTKLPILAYINPANLITDGLYSLYYYDTLNRYFINLGLLGAYGLIFCILTYLILRRQKYASI